MDTFLRGFDGKAEILKKAWQEKQMMAIDVSKELEDLVEMYLKTEERLFNKEADELEYLTACMARYLEVRTNRIKISEKLETLRQKLAEGEYVGEDKEEDEDE